MPASNAKCFCFRPSSFYRLNEITPFCCSLDIITGRHAWISSEISPVIFPLDEDNSSLEQNCSHFYIHICYLLCVIKLIFVQACSRSVRRGGTGLLHRLSDTRVNLYGAIVIFKARRYNNVFSCTGQFWDFWLFMTCFRVVGRKYPQCTFSVYFICICRFQSALQQLHTPNFTV